MLYLSAEDFYEKTSDIKRLSRSEERYYAERMKAGDLEAREIIITANLPYVASCVKHLHKEYQTLELIYRCCRALEKAVDQFDFFQDGESFMHRLSWWMRQTVTRYIAEK